MKKYIPSLILGVVALVIVASLFVFLNSRPEKNVGPSENGDEKILAMELSSDGSSYTVTGLGSLEGGDIVIPAEYKGVPIKEIGSRAFWGKSEVTSVVIPDTVEAIREAAFRGISAKEIILPDSVKIIEGYAFTDCQNLEKAVLPKNVDLLGVHLFENCAKLTEVNIPENITEIPEYMFTRCTLLESVTLPDGIETVGEQAFHVCNSLRNIELPGSVSKICKDAFWGARLEKIVLPEGIKEIGGNAFMGNPLSEANLPDGLEKIGNRAFQATDLESVHIPASVTEIGSAAFCSSYGFTDVGGIKDLTVAEDNPVYYSANNCIILKDTGELIFAPNPESVPDDGSVKIIGAEVYSEADADRVVIPEGVTLLKKHAIVGFERIGEIVLPASLEKIESGAISATDSKGNSVKSIIFSGGHDQWAAMEREEDWLSETDKVLIIDVTG